MFLPFVVIIISEELIYNGYIYIGTTLILFIYFKTPFGITGTRLSQATTLIENMVVHIAQTTCVRWRLKTADDTYFVKITGDQNG